MTVKRPRPIFRTGALRGRWFRRSGLRLPLDLPGTGSGYRRRPSNAAPWVLMLGLVLAGGAAGFYFWGRMHIPATVSVARQHPAGTAPASVPTPNLGHLAAAPGGAIVVDGDTLRLQNAVVRLDGVAAPARGDACDHTARSDCATAAAAQLAVLVRDQPVSCQVVGHDPLGRPSARCDVGLATREPEAGGNLNQQIVASGWARAQTAELEPEERAARASHRGLWAGEPASGTNSANP